MRWVNPAISQNTRARGFLRGACASIFPTLNRHFPDTEVVGRDLPSLGVPRQRNSIAADSLKAKTARCPSRWAETRCFVLIKAYLCRRRLWHLTSSPGHVGAGRPKLGDQHQDFLEHLSR